MGSKMRLMSSKLPMAMPSGTATAMDSAKALRMRRPDTATEPSRSFSKTR